MCPPLLSLSTDPPLSDRHFVTNYITSIGGGGTTGSLAVCLLRSWALNGLMNLTNNKSYFLLFCPSACIMFHFEQKKRRDKITWQLLKKNIIKYLLWPVTFFSLPFYFWVPDGNPLLNIVLSYIDRVGKKGRKQSRE